MGGDIIQTTLEALRQRLDDTFQNADRRPDEWVLLSNLVDLEGHPFDGARNKLVLSLVNIAPETSLSASWGAAPTKGGSYVTTPPPLHVELFLLFTANFAGNNYPQGVGMISRTVSFFQQNPVFTRESAPELDPSISKLSLDLVRLDFADISHLVGVMGVRYLPMVCYRLRMLTFASAAFQAEVAAARGISTRGGPAEPAAPAPPIQPDVHDASKPIK